MAYDWRTQHVKEFEEEILQYKKHGLEFFAFGKGMRRHSDCSKNIKSIRRFGIPYVALKPIVRRLGWRLRRQQCCPWFSGPRNWAANSGSTTMEGGVGTGQSGGGVPIFAQASQRETRWYCL